MVLKLTFFLWALGLLSTSLAVAQQNSGATTAAVAPGDSIQRSPPITASADPATDDFTPMLGIIAMLALSVALVGVGVGIALAVLALAIIAVLFGIGLTTSAVMVGLWRRSWAAGLRTLLWLLATSGGIVIGAAFSAGINAIVHLWLAGRWNGGFYVVAFGRASSIHLAASVGAAS
nr:hypothetical protein [Tanacetum cinerariifolium]